MERQQKHSKELEEEVRIRTFELLESNKLLQQKNNELSQAKEKFLSEYSRNLIEATLDPLITIDVQGKITDVNEAMVKATDKSREKLTGSNFSSYFIEVEKAAEVYRQVFAEGNVLNYPLTIMDGVLTDVLINASVYKDAQGKVTGAVMVARDITQLKKIEKELTEAKIFAELATGIAEKATMTAENAQGKAEDAVKSKQQFLSNMSHEIRTPMNAIIGFTKVLQRTNLSARQKEYLAAIKISGDSLIVLINDILDLAKVDAGKMTFQQVPFKPAQSVSAMLHLFETKIQEKNLTLVKKYDPNIPEVLLGDPVRLHQIILNLVSNAVKFTTKGTITVSIYLLNEDEKKVTVQFSVKDTGIGIEENEIQGVFENFQQAHSNSSTLYEGTGLGLAIVKQLVELQGGNIEMESTINEGSVFSFILSFEKTTVAVPVATAIIKLDTAIKNIQVLVVEDIVLNQMLMKTLLDDFGFECDICTNGKIAIEKLATKSYDIILMDLQMPEMNGFETTEYIRSKMGSGIPIIALTADVTTVDLAKCKAAGMNDYIAKPVDEGILYGKIVALVSAPAAAETGKAGTSLHHENGLIKTNGTNISPIDMSYLTRITKANPKLMTEMISLYLEQTPALITAMKQSFVNKDWGTLYSAVHKMVPSFSIVGIHSDFETMAKKIQGYAKTQKAEDGIQDMVEQLETVCSRACKELEAELHRLKTSAHA